MPSPTPPPPTPIQPNITPTFEFTFKPVMTETQPPRLGSMALPPPSFMDSRFSNGPYLPPPPQLSAPYFPPAPVPRSSYNSPQYSPPAQPAANPGHSHYQSSSPPSQRIRQYAPNHRGPASSSSPPSSAASTTIAAAAAAAAATTSPSSSSSTTAAAAVAALASDSANRYYSSQFLPRPEDGPLPAGARPTTQQSPGQQGQRGPPLSGHDTQQLQLRRRPLQDYSGPTHGPVGVAGYRDPTPTTIPGAFTASVSPASTEKPFFKASSNTHEIRVRQQPIAARACGFGERDRRVIDPPPIIQLSIKDNGAPRSDQDDIRYPFNVVHCSLWSEDGRCDVTGIPGQDGRNTRRLMGTLVASPFYGKDENDREGCFFCFPDLSCRTHGRYRLRFVLMRLEPNDLRPGQFMPTVTETESEIFTVFTAKDFPGMRASTALTKSLKRQGCAISVKKGNDRSNNSSHAVQEDDSVGDDSERSSSSKGSRPKKQRRR